LQVQLRQSRHGAKGDRTTVKRYDIRRDLSPAGAYLAFGD
jgi:hypothetical protein